MTRADLASAVSKTTGMGIGEADEAVSAVFGCVKELVAKGGGLVIRGFGSFTAVNKPARMGRNPKTGKPAPIKARRVVRFKAGQKFKENVNSQEVEK